MPSTIDVVSENFIFVDYQSLPERYVQKIVGVLSDQELSDLAKATKDSSYLLLQQISGRNYIVFNRSQCLRLKNEIDALRSKNLGLSAILSKIYEGIEQIIKDRHLFLRFDF